MQIRRLVLVAAALCASALGGGLYGTLASAGPGGDQSEDRPERGPWPRDVDGDGVTSDSGDERIPALVLAIGSDGTEGYVRLEDLEGTEPTSPEEAARLERERPSSIPLYDEDGTTVIGEFRSEGGSSTERSRDRTSRDPSR